MGRELNGPARWPALAVWAVAAFMLTVWLGRGDLLDPDEARHAEIAREMLASGHYLTPKLHGQPYYDKPVLFHWLAAASMRLFGENAAAVRLPSVLSAFWVLAVTGWWASRAYSTSTARLAVLGLATTLTFVALGRYAILDMLLTAATTSALAWLGAWALDPPHARRSIYPFYVAVGIACLAKGPVAIAICGLTALATALWIGGLRAATEARPLRGGLLMLAVASPWYLAAWLADPAYIETFLWHHNVERYAAAISLTHTDPWYYYLVALPLGLMPWTPIVAAALVARLGSGTRQPADAYCLLWAAVIVLFFLPGQTRLITYLLPAFPPLVCLGAALVSGGEDRAPSLGRLEAPFGAFAVAWTGLLAATALGGAAYFAATLPQLRWSAVLALPLVAVFAWTVRSRQASDGGATRLVQIAAASAASVALAYGLVADVLDHTKGTREAAAFITQTLPAGADLASYRCQPHALSFYAKRITRRADTPAEATHGLLAPGSAALLTKEKRLPELGLDPLPAGIYRAWEAPGGLVLLHKPGADEVELAEKGGSRTLRRP